jgi:2-polyprenyl-3-methyl-5-hydroxy-6-metoxy-1,4-benzoquinol methylase
MDKTREPQYQFLVELKERQGLSSFGIMSNQVWNDDPRRLAFTLARYKFVSKMLSGRSSVLEIGCADAFGTRIVLQEVGRVTAIDFDPVFIEDVKGRRSERWPIDAHVHDMVSGPFPGTYDAAYALDVLEHIQAADEDRFLANVNVSLAAQGIAIYGMPSLESQSYASAGSKEGHVNCKSGKDLKKTLLRHFENVFLFSMNDEVVHTGFLPMAHYIIGLCVTPRRRGG